MLNISQHSKVEIVEFNKTHVKIWQAPALCVPIEPWKASVHAYRQEGMS